MATLIYDTAESIFNYRKPLQKSSEVNYKIQFTRNKNLIEQYKLLRKELYESDPRFVGFRIFKEAHAEDYEDYDDQMVILSDGNRCYGGACLRISTQEKYVTLDLENDIAPSNGKSYFSLQEHFPEMELGKYSYAEFNRIVIHPSLRKGEATRRIFQAVLNRCLDYRVRYMFGIGDCVRIRLYRQIYHHMGLDAHICNNVDIPVSDEYEGLKMLLLAGDMKNFYVTKNDPEATCLTKPISNYKFY